MNMRSRVGGWQWTGTWLYTHNAVTQIPPVNIESHYSL